MRRLAMTFRGILRSKAVSKLETWLKDLAFDGVTEDLRRLHRLPIQLNSNGAGVGIVSTDAALAMYIDFDAIRALLESLGTQLMGGAACRHRTRSRRLRAPVHQIETP
jgi:hypothetical protein